MNKNIEEVFESLNKIDDVVFESYIKVAEAISSIYDKQIMIMESTDTDTEEFNIFQEAFYQESTSKKEQHRIDNFLKQNNYDPKTQTIDTDIKDSNGKKRRVNFQTLDNPQNGPAFCQADPYENKVENSSIMLTRELMKRKPHISNGMFKHEEGHVAYRTGNIDKKSTFMENLKRAQQRIDRSKKDLHEHDKDAEEYAVDAYAAEHTKKGIDGMRRALQAMTSSDVKMKRNHKKVIALTKKTLDDSYTFDNIPYIIDAFGSNIEMMKRMIDGEREELECFGECMDAEAKAVNAKNIKSYEDALNALQPIYDSLKKANDSKDSNELKSVITKLKNDGINEVTKVIRQTDNGIKERRAFLNSLKYKK